MKNQGVTSVWILGHSLRKAKIVLVIHFKKLYDEFIRFSEFFSDHYSYSAVKSESIITILSPHEIEDIKHYINEAVTPLQLRDSAIVLLGTEMGIRGSDIVRLRISDICFKDRTIRFVQGKRKIASITQYILGEVRAGNYLISYKSPTIFLAAICLLLFFKRIKIPPLLKKIVVFISPMTFGVYLIHTHPLIYSWMGGKFVDYNQLHWILEIITVIGTAILISLVCYAIEFVRLYLFKLLHIREKLDLLEKNFKY